jgi:hypothetical protein
MKLVSPYRPFTERIKVSLIPTIAFPESPKRSAKGENPGIIVSSCGGPLGRKRKS